MKTMTCKQLGGACELEFTANTFEEIAAMSKQHGMEMFEAGDQSHLNAMTAIFYSENQTTHSNEVRLIYFIFIFNHSSYRTLVEIFHIYFV